MAKLAGFLKKYGGEMLKGIGLISIGDKVLGVKDSTLLFAVIGGVLALFLLGGKR
jgi:uncharacterized membrane protein